MVATVLQDNIESSVVATGEGQNAVGADGDAELVGVAGALANETALTSARSEFLSA